MVFLYKPKKKNNRSSLGQEDEMNGWIRRLDVKGRKTFFTGVSPTRDGGVVAVANFVVTDDVNAFTQPWVIKLDAADNIVWQRRLQASADDYLSAVAAGEDFHVLTGSTLRVVRGVDRFFDLWVVALRPKDGSVLWSRAFGGDRSETGRSVRRTRDGNILVAGETSSFALRDLDAWVLELDAAGDPVWQTAYNADGLSQSHGTGAIAQDPGSSRLLLAGNVVFQPTSALNAWVLGLEGDGTPVRSLVFPATDPPGMTLADGFHDVQATPQPGLGDGFVVVGDTEHFRHNVQPWPDGWLLRFDLKAGLIWQRLITQPGSHRGWSVTPIVPPAGDPLPPGFLAAGSVGLEGLRNARAWLLRVDPGGGRLEEKIYDTSFDPVSRNDPTVFRSVVQKVPLDAAIAVGDSHLASAEEKYDKGFAVSSPLVPLPDNCPKPFESTFLPGPPSQDVTPLATPTTAEPKDLKTLAEAVPFDDRFICHT
jgi:hypothetical protein